VMLWLLALIRFDRWPLPPRLTLFTILVVAIVLVAVPKFTVVSWQQLKIGVFYDGAGNPIDGLLRVISALVAATMIGRSLARRVSQTADLKLDPLGSDTRRLVDLIALLSLVILIVGWQSGLSVVAFAIVLAALAQRLLDRTNPDSKWRDPLSALAVSLPVALSLQLFFWKTVHRLWIWPSDVAPPMTVIAWAICLLLLPTLLIPLLIPRPKIIPEIDDESE
jgi:leader peptidase (prepilin peptidase) / N-methyltransferase